MLNFLFDSTQGGVTTAVNVVVGATSTATAVTGNQMMVTVGANPIHIRFGTVGTTAVSATNGLYLPALSMNVFARPEGATHLLHIRSGASDSAISIQSGNAATGY